MPGKPVRMYSGVDSVRAADAYRIALESRRENWPYPHIYSPQNAIDVVAVSALATQATVGLGGAAVAVVTYRVNAGKRFYLRGVLLNANVTIVPGQALFTIDRNSAIGIADTQFMPEHGFVNIPFAMGTQGLPWFLFRAREFSPLDTIRIKATNVGLSVGDPNYWICGLFGYEAPTLDVKESR